MSRVSMYGSTCIFIYLVLSLFSSLNRLVGSQGQESTSLSLQPGEPFVALGYRLENAELRGSCVGELRTTLAALGPDLL